MYICPKCGTTDEYPPERQSQSDGSIDRRCRSCGHDELTKAVQCPLCNEHYGEWSISRGDVCVNCASDLVNRLKPILLKFTLADVESFYEPFAGLEPGTGLAWILFKLILDKTFHPEEITALRGVLDGICLADCFSREERIDRWGREYDGAA